MAKEKKSFFEKLTGSIRLDSDDDSLDIQSSKKISVRDEDDLIEEEIEREGELTVDVFQTPDMIVIKTMVAGVRPEDLDISITRDIVTIRGHREEEKTVREEDYFSRELYWGTFSRTVSLPAEVDVDEAEAVEKHGLLILKLPKLDKKRQNKLKVRTI